MTAPKRTRRARSILFIEIILIIAALFIAAIVYLSGKMNRISWKDSDIYMNDVNDDNMSGYTNIALFGVDSRENELTKKTRSDSIIIASINNKTHDVKLVSIYRDTFVYIPKHGYTKLNHAYAYGGPKLAIETINRNFDMNITDFITINFSGLTDVIDALGGVTIRIKKDELKYVNRYAKDVANINKKEWSEIKAPGEQLLTGVQATGYSRVRYTKGGDFRRTNRQRTVINAILDKAKHSGPVKLTKAANAVLPQTYTSLDGMEFARLSLYLPFYDIEEQTGFPFNCTPKKINGADVIVCNTYVSNVTELHQYLFGTDNYKPSDTVRSLKQH